MKLIENTKKSISLALAKVDRLGVPRGHILAVSLLGASLTVISVIPGQQAQASRSVGTLSLPQEAHIEAIIDAPEFIEQAPEYRDVVLTVKSGDTLSSLFKRAGLSDRVMMNFMHAAEQSKKLESIKPAHNLSFLFDEHDELQGLTYQSNRLDSFSYTKNGEGYDFKETHREPDIRRASRSGTIESSLYLSGQKNGLDDKLIMELAEVFGWDIDFALDIRKGDSFRILYEEKFLDGEKLGNGAILSAEFINQGESFQAVRYVHADDRAQYYTPEGRNMRKAFLRAPVDFRRISSSFNPRRLHPVTKTVRAHRGIDYAAKTGTPVWSSGDGRVIASAYSKYNGNYVVIQHGNNVQTKYLHLHKRKVKKGQRVRQKQVIGTVGTTGLSNGPHLHYEFLLNGVHRNPRTIVQKLPKAESISAKLKADFTSKTQPLMAQLIEETGTQLAFNHNAPSSSAL